MTGNVMLAVIPMILMLLMARKIMRWYMKKNDII